MKTVAVINLGPIKQSEIDWASNYQVGSCKYVKNIPSFKMRVDGEITEVHASIFSVPEDWNALACNECTCMDGWWGILEDGMFRLLD